MPHVPSLYRESTHFPRSPQTTSTYISLARAGSPSHSQQQGRQERKCLTFPASLEEWGKEEGLGCVSATQQLGHWLCSSPSCLLYFGQTLGQTWDLWSPGKIPGDVGSGTQPEQRQTSGKGCLSPRPGPHCAHLVPCAGSGLATNVCRKITGQLTSAIAQQEDVAVQLEALDILSDMLSRCGRPPWVLRKNG